jgi:hypothetical protein
MTKYIFLFIISFSLKSTNYNMEGTLGRLLSDNEPYINIEEIDELLESLENTRKRALEIPEDMPLAKKIKINNDDDLKYINLDSNLVEEYLNKLYQLDIGKSSYTLDGGVTTGIYEKTFDKIRNSKIKDFMPLFEEILKKISMAEKDSNTKRTAFHIAIRVDPNTNDMSGDKNRKLTSNFHEHGDKDRYLFVLTRDDNVTTIIKLNEEEKFIDKNRLFLLPGPMLHRTPPRTEGRRIQMSIGLGILP